MKKKKIITAILSVAVALCSMDVAQKTAVLKPLQKTVSAETVSETLTEDNLSYVMVDEDKDGISDYIEITDCNYMATEVVIPSEIEGLPFTTIGDCAFDGCTNLESIIIPKTTNINNYRKSSCKKTRSEKGRSVIDRPFVILIHKS